MYSTPTFAGSRPGALLACAWAALMSIGESGYRESAKSIISASQQIAQGISRIHGLRVLGSQSQTMIVCFTSDEMNIYSIGDVMTRKGWCLNDLQLPACIHLCVTLNVVPHVDTFLQELEESVTEVRAQGPVVKKKGNAKVYGMVGSVPEGPVNQILRIFTDLTLTP
jgi:sphinganine-1-phosphate aldolase